jgi:AbrB family looped-hinge helix DNA binding protein
MIATVTSKGQVTLPVEARKRWNLKPGMRLQFTIINNDRMEVVPMTQTIVCLKGMVPKPSAPLSIADMEKAIAEGACS